MENTQLASAHITGPKKTSPSAVIIAILAIVLVVVAFLFWKKLSEQDRLTAQLQGQVEQSKNDAAQAQSQLSEARTNGAALQKQLEESKQNATQLQQQLELDVVESFVAHVDRGQL